MYHTNSDSTRYLVDTVPALMYLPTWLAPFKREGARLHADELNCFRELLQDGLKAGQGVSGSNNWCSRWYDSRDAYNISEDHVAYALGTLFEAGAGTTASAMMSFMLTMTLHPKEFQKLQEEVDKVVGADRLPGRLQLQALALELVSNAPWHTPVLCGRASKHTDSS